jgi:hypothetical protein
MSGREAIVEVCKRFGGKATYQPLTPMVDFDISSLYAPDGAMSSTGVACAGSSAGMRIDPICSIQFEKIDCRSIQNARL